MNKNTILEIMRVKLDNKILAKEMEEYHKVYDHKKPCKEWIENKWCEHYIKARTQKFRKRINGQLNKMLKLSQKRVL